MPLIIIVGTPCSGKTFRTHELEKAFAEKGKKVDVITEEGVLKKLGYEKNEAYSDSQKEKRMRSFLKSEVTKLVGKENLVILDGSNYIKGFRYELYCSSKAVKSTQCTVYTLRNHDEAKCVNEQRKERERNIKDIDKSEGASLDEGDSNSESAAYTDEVFEALTKFRFEEPNGQHRWDSPLFIIHPTDELDIEGIYKALYENKPPPPNMSTQNPPLSSTNFLYELDRVTQSVSSQIVEAKRQQCEKLADYPDCPLTPAILDSATPQRLLQLRRQFLTYARQHYSANDTSELARHFIRYLNNTVHD